jgi:AraC-like DNA-binding protein
MPLHAPIPSLTLVKDAVTGDLKIANEYCSTYLTEQHISPRGAADRVRFDCKRWGVGDIHVCDFAYGDIEVDVEIKHLQCRKFFLVAPLQGNAHVMLPHKRLSLAPGAAIVFEAADRMAFVDTVGFRNLNIGVPYSTLKDFLSAELGRPCERDIRFASEPIPVDGELRCLLDYVRWVWVQLENAGLRDGRRLARHVHDTLLALLVSTAGNNYQELYRAGGARDAAPRYVRDAEDVMRTNVREVVSVAEVARTVGVAPRTLHLAFQRHRNYSPGQFLRNERLALARRELATARQRGLTVTDVAFACGFLHPGKFSQLYRQRYGELPSETLRGGAGR